MMTLKALLFLIALVTLSGCADNAYEPDYIISKEAPASTPKEEPPQQGLR